MTSERERDAIRLLEQLHMRKAGHPLHDADMVAEWMDEQIMAFIRKYGAFAEQLRQGDEDG